jgi:hypothetical protein
MVADWSVECSAEDPVLVVPWSAASSVLSRPSMDKATPYGAQGDGIGEGGFQAGAFAGGQFIDLRENPYDLDQIPEAELYPPLMQALRALNVPRSPVFTAKCDAWLLDSEEIEDLRERMDLQGSSDPIAGPDSRERMAGFASYIDLIWRDRTIFASFHQSEQLLHRLTRLAAQLDHPWAMLDCVLRPALVDLTGPQEGYSITLYIKALGVDRETAQEAWSVALQAVVALLRSKDIAFV